MTPFRSQRSPSGPGSRSTMVTLMATACQGHAQIESGRTGTDNGGTHGLSPFCVTIRVMVTLSVT